MVAQKEATVSKKDEEGKNTPAVKSKRAKKIMAKQSDSELNISDIQDLQLRVIAHTTHNNCDGRKIEKLLRENHRLWRAVMMPNKQLYPLRDMQDGLWSADTLYMLPQEGKESELEELVKEQFNADEINWIGSDQTLELLGYWKKDKVQNSKLMLSVWWD